MMDSNGSSTPWFWFNFQSNCVSAVFALKSYFWTMFSASLFSCTLLCWHGFTCSKAFHKPEHSAPFPMICGQPQASKAQLWKPGLTCCLWTLYRTNIQALSRLGQYLLVIYLVGNAGSYTKLSSSWGYPMETNLSTVRSNPRDSYSGDLYTVPRWDFS